MSERISRHKSRAEDPGRHQTEALASEQAAARGSSPESARVGAWIADAESQAAIRRALMDCYNS
jgi:hypothetical protein